eukprot:4190098-Prymnesium_polylepis.1
MRVQGFQIRCFVVAADVDYLEHIDHLEQYVESSQRFLLFLSKGYFYSNNCLRECNHALGSEKPLILVHEKDEEKGGAPLATSCADCESNGCYI